jgi:catechol 2,3-dioxygenase-like lactoylglutathione lyase family enzyme
MVRLIGCLRRCSLLALLVVHSSLFLAQNPAPVTRPAIVGVAHIALRTDNLAAARKFYTGVLGFQEPFTYTLPPEEGGKFLLTYFKVNVEMFPELTDPKQDRLSHIAFETTDAQQLRDYLASKGVKVPEKLDPMGDGNRGFDVTDPDGHDVEFVEYRPGSLHSNAFGKFLPDTRISQRIIHVGVVVGDRAAADHFYKDILGFREIWHGGMKDSDTDWVDMRVPDGTDWLEYMLNQPAHPDLRLTGVMNHISYGVADMNKAQSALESHGWKQHGDEHAQMGRDGKRQLNVFDPDLTRIELMEFKPAEKPCCSDFTAAHPSESE